MHTAHVLFPIVSVCVCAILPGKLNEIASVEKKYIIIRISRTPTPIHTHTIQQTRTLRKVLVLPMSTQLNCILEQTNNLVLKSRDNFVFTISLSLVFHTFFHFFSILLLFIWMVFFCFLVCTATYALNRPYQLSTAFWVNCWDAQCIYGDFVVVSIYTLIVVQCVWFHSHACTFSFFLPQYNSYVVVDHFVYTIYKTPASFYVCICAYEHVSSPIRISK